MTRAIGNVARLFTRNFYKAIERRTAWAQPLNNICANPGADRGSEGKSKRVGKNGPKLRKTKNILYFSSHPFFPARLNFSSPPLSAPESPRMVQT